ncbi:3-hydroxybutyryl-CoA dehydrogenase [Hypericibacter adhaerens]|uniref:3-hydroxybutyryl-CoA dehydrogenase n=1 Tax=Hypericibacter adhaerens TaxID=2602016 RepID=A0A5J6MWT3_9PROT|nr:3-hydroxyacyl-CoA dehydrogenase family protein [Hypericibacter adhaerens]QEX21959.1 3-hydroxybutyryl-CoA dehydrogenase [Hypericibacter adhaerens]
MKDDIRKIGVVGAGLMGAEIALTFAIAGYPVRLIDQTEERVAAARERLLVLVRKGIARGLYAPEQKDPIFERLTTGTALESLADCDFITEAVFEEEGVKAEVFRSLDRFCQPGCIIASNTSTLPISTLASYVGAARRSRFLGTHYFSPVSRMKLVEVIPAFATAPEIVARVRALCEEAGKTTVLIKDVTGFAVNRMLHAFVIEAIRLVEEGVASPEDIDLACKLALGHPMGPFELMDATSSHLCLQVHEILYGAYGERFRPRPLLKQRVKAGFVGGRGKPGWRKRR